MTAVFYVQAEHACRVVGLPDIVQCHAQLNLSGGRPMLLDEQVARTSMEWMLESKGKLDEHCKAAGYDCAQLLQRAVEIERRKPP